MMKNVWTFAITLVGVAASGALHAAPVTWGTPFEFTSSSDIDLSFGPFVYAQNGGDNIGNEAFIPAATLPTITDPKVVTVGSTAISFEGIETVYGDDASFGQLGFPFETFGDAVDHLEGQNFNVTFDVRNGRTVNIPQVVYDPTPATLFDPLEEDDYSVTTLDVELDSVLDSQVFMDSRFSLGDTASLATAGAIEIFLNNLSIGTEYQVQIIGGADDRTFLNDPQVIDPTYMANSTGKGVSPIGTMSDGLGNTVANVGAFLDLDQDGIGHVTSVLGTFTADSTTQQVDFLLQRGRNAGISAVILTEAGAVVTPGDFNGDGMVDVLDLAVWENNFGATEDGAVLKGNGNGGIVDGSDYALWRSNLGLGVGQATLTGVPEPSGACLLFASVFFTTASCRRGRQ